METRLKPVPAFYCCYLLRSTIRHSSLYVGSSPHPARRIGQHNGKSKGGAVRTSRSSLRPWEMVCIVLGFTSNIAALQFEWAWHNAHLTKHISPEDRLTLPTVKTKMNHKTGKPRKKLGRPRTSLIDKLSNLHLLLRAPYFSHMPLELRFFNAGVFKAWQTWDQRLDKHVPSRIPILLDVPADAATEFQDNKSDTASKKRKAEMFGTGGVPGIDPTYAQFQPVLHKLQKRLALGDSQICHICSEQIDPDKDLFNICLAEECSSITHVSCLSTHFLKQERPQAIVPIAGKCPSCHSALRWSDLARVLTLRMRADKEVAKLLKKRKTGVSAVAADLLEEESGSEEDNSEMIDATDEDEDENEESGVDGDVLVTKASNSIPGPEPKSPRRNGNPGKNRVEIVIEDSEIED